MMLRSPAPGERHGARLASRRARFILFHLVVAFALGLLLLAVFEFTDLDQRLSSLFYDPSQQAFSLRHDWFLEVVLHHWAKYLLVVFALAMLGGFVLSFSLAPLRSLRPPMLYMLLVMAMGTSAISGLKAISSKHCPYDLEIYNGYAPYVGLLQRPAPDMQPGRCFPGGHASGGFSLMAAFFIWRQRRPRRAYLVLAATFACGFVLGFGRIMQGAHFLSHNLWTAWICWVAAIALYPVVAGFAEHYETRQGGRND